MKKLSLFLFTLAIVVSSCQRSEYSGYKMTENGLYYKIINKSDAEKKASLGDLLTVTMYYALHHNDSIIFDSRTMPHPLSLSVTEPNFNGDINEGLFLLSEGDSASFITRADSFFVHNVKLQQVPEFIKDEMMLRFEIKVLKHKTQEEFNKETMLRVEQEEKIHNELREQEKKELQEYIAKENITVSPTLSGMFFISKREGSGKYIKPGDLVKAHYTGYFLDGSVFDTSVGASSPFEFQVGYGGVIQGWEEAALKMKKGSRARIILPSSLAYGKSSPDFPIPPFTPLMFDIEIIDVISPSK